MQTKKLLPIGVVALGSVMALLTSSGVRADTIFEVEHARAAARAGWVSPQDEEFLERYGVPSGYHKHGYRDDWSRDERRAYSRKRYYRGVRPD